jgi:hypothetical protein
VRCVREFNRFKPTQTIDLMCFCIQITIANHAPVQYGISLALHPGGLTARLLRLEVRISASARFSTEKSLLVVFRNGMEGKSIGDGVQQRVPSLPVNLILKIRLQVGSHISVTHRGAQQNGTIFRSRLHNN